MITVRGSYKYLSFWLGVVFLILSVWMFEDGSTLQLSYSITGMWFLGITHLEIIIDNQTRLYEKLNGE